MSDTLRKGFLLGLGAAISGKEKLDTKLKEMVDKNELTQEQARNMMDSFVVKGEMKRDEWNSKQYDQTRKMAKDLGLATREDINELRARITQLEAKLGEDEQ
ncbi:phasin family protein [Virgibacillus xinjiangensis]|uniref:Phasin family protein n=1 Tax=Virgibacillus xinjiangensis TaxID=393090 RepID=A0ABV7CQR9_9BACI